MESRFNFGKRQIEPVPSLPNFVYSTTTTTTTRTLLSNHLPMSPLPLEGLINRGKKRAYNPEGTEPQTEGSTSSGKRRISELAPSSSDRDGSPSSSSLDVGDSLARIPPSASSTSTNVNNNTSVAAVFAGSTLFNPQHARPPSFLPSTSNNRASSSNNGTSGSNFIASSRAFFPKGLGGFQSSPSSSSSHLAIKPPPSAPQQHLPLSSVSPSEPSHQQQKQQERERSATPYETFEDDEDFVKTQVIEDDEEDAYMRGGSQQQSQQSQNRDEVEDDEDLIEILDEGGYDDDDEHLGPPASQVSSYWEGSQTSASQVSRYDDYEDDDLEIEMEPDEERQGSVGRHEDVEEEDEEDDDEDGRGGGRRAFSQAVEDLGSRQPSQELERIPSSDDQQNEDEPGASQNESQLQERRSSFSNGSHLPQNQDSIDDQPASSPRASPIPVPPQQQQHRLTPPPPPPAAPAPREFDALIRAAVEKSGDRLKELEAMYEEENLEGEAFTMRGDGEFASPPLRPVLSPLSFAFFPSLVHSLFCSNFRALGSNLEPLRKGQQPSRRKIQAFPRRRIGHQSSQGGTRSSSSRPLRLRLRADLL
ncbi:hypothetical protein BDY24DRAFT_376253 [Mrakia frigida]|uniref:uncharacterized protein n=1 Tax=Mrakia frigida TaxID=29902 RepID=UPI003FCBF433